MDARINNFETVPGNSNRKTNVKPALNINSQPAITKSITPPIKQRLSNLNETLKQPKNKKKGRELVKAGMAASLGVSILTGMKILRPMKMHTSASWIFLGLSVVHTLMYDPANKKPVPKKK